jgi:hypothetical protein
MQPAQRPLQRVADVVVLDERRLDPGRGKIRAFHTSEEKPRTSPMRRGMMTLISGSAVSRICI